MGIWGSESDVPPFVYNMRTKLRVGIQFWGLARDHDLPCSFAIYGEKNVPFQCFRDANPE